VKDLEKELSEKEEEFENLKKKVEKALAKAGLQVTALSKYNENMITADKIIFDQL
jgi:hypothetical protein